jgi:predicted DNA-binding WGR domain protein
LDWEQPPPDFSYVLFDATERRTNKQRFYYLGWQQTLLDAGAVVRIWGRKGGHQRHLSPQSFESLEEAWPLLRSIIKRRLRHGYKIVEPEEFAGGREAR